MNPIGPRGVYDEAKRYAEALTMAYHGQQGLDTAIVRIFNTYGVRMRPNDGRAVSNFVRQALAEEPLTVFGDGSQTRSFCYVDDLIEDRRNARAASICRSTSAIPTTHAARAGRDREAHAGSWRRARSFSRRCGSTTRCSASRTSPGRSSCSAGNPRSRLKKASRGCCASRAASRSASGTEPLLVRTLRRDGTERTPVWFMRQARPCSRSTRATGAAQLLRYRRDAGALRRGDAAAGAPARRRRGRAVRRHRRARPRHGPRRRARRASNWWWRSGSTRPPRSSGCGSWTPRRWAAPILEAVHLVRGDSSRTARSWATAAPRSRLPATSSKVDEAATSSAPRR